MTEKEIKNLISKIRKAFSNTQYPGDSKIGRGEEYEIKAFIDQKWQDLTLEELFTDQFPHRFTAKGMQYFIPAFLIAILSNPTDWRSQELAKRFINSLTPHPSAIQDIHKPPKTVYTKQQFSLILDFVKMYKNLQSDEEIEETINRCLAFWANYVN